MEDLLIFKQKLTQIMEDKGVNSLEFSKVTKLSSRQMTDYQRDITFDKDGEPKGPSVPGYWTLRSILKAYPDISAEWLMRDSGPMKVTEDWLKRLTSGGTNVNIDSNVASGAYSTVGVNDQSDLVAYLKAENSRLLAELAQKDKRINDLTDRLLDGR
ncbi:MAG: hypothetical protein MJZ30_05950 [Paludibacteraceae bacterium]|nr:hypothetical protein [Paludibacteraceae bacterium]